MYSDMPCPNFTTLGKWGLRQLLDMILNWSPQKIASLVLVVVMKSVALSFIDSVAGWLTTFCNKTVVQVVWWIHFFLFEFGPGQLTSFHFIHSYEIGFYNPTVLKFHPPICGITAHATMPGLLSTICFAYMILIQINGAWKMGSTAGAWTHDLSVMSLLP